MHDILLDQMIEELDGLVRDHTKPLTRAMLAAIGGEFTDGDRPFCEIKFGSPYTEEVKLIIVSKGGASAFVDGGSKGVPLKPIRTKSGLFAALRVLDAPEELIERVKKI